MTWNLLNKIILSILALISITAISEGSAYAQNDEIPVWVKGVAGYWIEGKITDSEFIEAIEFLIESGIIQVQQIQPTAEPTVEPTAEPVVDCFRIDNRDWVNCPEPVIEPESVAEPTVEPTQDQQLIQINPLETNYTAGDTIIISGIINEAIRYNGALTYIIINSDDDRISLGQKSVNSNGEFVINILLSESDLWKNDTYTIKFIYGSNETTKTFNYYHNPTLAEPTQDQQHIQINPLETNYTAGDTIIISGIINKDSIDKNKDSIDNGILTYFVKNSDDRTILIGQETVNSNGEFTITTYPGGSVWKSGTHTITFNYGSDEIETTKTFNYHHNP